jgi:hypothetical protein
MPLQLLFPLLPAPPVVRGPNTGSQDAIILFQMGLGSYASTSNNVSTGPVVGDIGLLVQDGAGNWYFYFWAVDAVFCEKVDMSQVDSFDALNKEIKKRTGYSSSYHDSIYLEGDFANTLSYCMTQADRYNNRKTPTKINFSYNLLTNNCSISSMRALSLSYYGTFGPLIAPTYTPGIGFTPICTATIPLSTFYALKQLIPEDRQGVLSIEK